ncbi:carboxylesterase/lipase family protein [Alteraurantiacibacter palmitatis]|uniref:Carboxylic ester hydrolase n=1 Tax=Alteraurantiacibacter palmitatis TaxID=2054628 RepID=A0ABV7E8H9_9SPHN
MAGVLAATSLAAMPGRSWAQMGEPVVETAQGRLAGLLDADGVASFRGVRYARAQRFMPPQPPESWAGVRAARQFGASAPQTNASPPPGPPYVITAQIPRPEGAPPPPPPLPEDEACQFLNIWTAALGHQVRRPVMVWLHGGLFYGGSGSTIDGSALAASGEVVVVSLNHRLNAFGFTWLGDFDADFAHSGNAGMLDIIAALRWLKQNIAAFGGDPERITVFGTSGGGMKAAFLMASPAAAGMVQRAAAQSGPALRFMEVEQARRATHALFAALDLPQGDVRALQQVPAARLLAAYHSVAAQMRASRFIDLPCFAPVVDGDLLVQHPFAPQPAPQTRAIPMVLGWNAQEMSFFMGADPAGFTLDESGLETRMQGLFGERAAGLLALYRQAYPKASPSRLWIQAHSDYSIMLPVMAQASRRAAAADTHGGADSFVYRLDFQSPALGGKLGALHTLEANLLFNTPRAGTAVLGEGPGPELLAARMSAAWARFAHTGVPDSGLADVPEWSRFDLASQNVMVFDEQCRIEGDPSAAVRAAMADMLDA